MAFLAFVADALTMAELMFVRALAQEGVVAKLRASTVEVKVWGGRILVFVGGWLIGLAIWADFFVQFMPM